MTAHIQSNAANQAPLAGRREWIGLAVLALACLLYAMDLTVLHLALPTITAELRPSSTQLLWIDDIYGFLVAGSLLTMGTLGDRIGRRRLLLIGASAFGAISIAAAFANSPEMLIACRALLGLAGATLAPSTLSLIFSMFQHPRERSLAIGIWITAFSAGGAVGPVLGGLLLAHFRWGSVFLLCVPVMALLLVLGPRVLPEYRSPDAGRIDLLSAAMSLVAVLAATVGIKEAAQHGLDPRAATFLAVGLAVGTLFVRRQLTRPDPLIDVRLFSIPAFRAALLINVLSIFVAVGYFLFIAQYLQLVLGLTPLVAGLWSLPSSAGFIVGAQLAPRIGRRVRPAVLMGVSLALAATGLILLTRVGATGGLGLLVAASLVISLGLSPVLTLTTDLNVGSAPPERAGAASGLSETAIELGGSLGIAILGSIGVAIYRHDLAGAIPAGVPADSAAVARDTLAGAVTVAGQLPASVGEPLLATARDAFLQGMHLTSGLAAIAAIALAVLAATSLRHLRPAAEQHAEQHAEPEPEPIPVPLPFPDFNLPPFDPCEQAAD
jgi:DHA2 family multidrug resistance protein-like MFS transporter